MAKVYHALLTLMGENATKNLAVKPHPTELGFQ